jgi:hypothetical protein
MRSEVSSGAPMSHTVISSDFLGSTTQERVAMCRKLAAEAGRHAEDAANPETKRSYFELKRQWEILAAELEATP